MTELGTPATPTAPDQNADDTASQRRRNGRSDPQMTGGRSKLAAQVARRIADDIARKGWPVGEVIGSQATLIAQYDTGRAVLREAVRLLEHHQLATMRRGPSGGLIVQAPDARATTTAAVSYLDYVGTTLDDLLRARLAIEPMAAELAAQHITEDDIAGLREALRADQAVDFQARASTTGNAVHRSIANLAGNPALEAFVDVLIQLTGMYMKPPSQAARSLVHTAADQADAAHTAIVEAIVSGDAAAARDRATAHLEAMRIWARGRKQTPSADLDVYDSGCDNKLAEVVSRRIRRDIIRRGWPIGTVIGAESDLLDTYKVSRAVLRQAIRLLEYHSVAVMRRGRGGGLTVCEPDPWPSIDTMAIYLQYRGIDVGALRVVRNVIELTCLDLLADQLTDQAILSRLRELRDVNADRSSRRRLQDMFRVHLGLAELSGSTVLPLFLRIVINLAERHADAAYQAGARRDDRLPAEAAEAHDAIIEALLAGDRGLAQHRMRRHLATQSAYWQ